MTIKYNNESQPYVRVFQISGLMCALQKFKSSKCNMTYFAHHVTSRDFGLRWNFDIDILLSTWIYFDSSREEEHDGAQIVLLAQLD